MKPPLNPPVPSSVPVVPLSNGVVYSFGGGDALRLNIDFELVYGRYICLIYSEIGVKLVLPQVPTS
jgi:hypothetical protein